MVLFITSLVTAEPRITSFDVTGLLAWTDVVPGHGYDVEHSSNLMPPWTAVISNMRARSEVLQTSVELSSDSGFFRIVDTGVSASPLSAIDLGSISGDTGLDAIPTSEIGDEFFLVRITENNSSILGKSLSVRMTLTSPLEMDYNLHVTYQNGSVVESTNPAGQLDVVDLSWNDTIGGDDTRELLIEIRRASGVLFTPWSLIIEGNWQ